MADLTFEQPGPGTWQLNDRHFTGPVSRYGREILRYSHVEGANRGRRLYGLPHELDIEIVNGYWYARMHWIDRPSAESSTGESQPTSEVATTEFDRRIANLEETFETKRWRSDLEKWDAEWKPELRDRNDDLQSVDLTHLDDDALIDHLAACRQTLRDAVFLHHRIAPCVYFPNFDFLGHAREWTDCPPDELVELLTGLSPDSVDVVADLYQLSAAIEQDQSALDVLFSETAPETILEQLRTHGGTVETAMEDWVAVAGYRLVSGWDLTEPYGLERPQTLVSTLRKAVRSEDATTDDHTTEAKLEAIREGVPPAQREEFDERFEEARRTFRVKDGRSLLDLRTRGLMRRALLEAGRRLAENGRLKEPSHVVDLQHDELLTLLRGGRRPRAIEVAAHVKYRRTHDNSDAPPELGSDQSPGMPYDEVPEALRRINRGSEARRWVESRGAKAPDSTGNVIRGLGASSGTAEGRARVVSGPESFEDIQDGDILVARATSSSFNVILSLLRGIVTDMGGMLSHPAIVAREFGIPGVVGCEDATDRIDDGDRIVVDGDEGTVRMRS